MTNTEAIAAIIAANTPLKAEQYATPYTLARSSAGHEAIWTNGQEAALGEATRDLGEARGELERAHATLRYIRRLIESEDCPGDRTRDVYDATAKALPY